MHEFESEHFLLYAPVPTRLDRLARIAERGCAEAARFTTLPVPEARVPICIYEDETDLESLKRHFRLERSPPGNGAFYPSAPLVLVRHHPGMEQTVSHEVTHWVIWRSAPNCPSMLNEGVAVLVAERVATEAMIEDLSPSLRPREIRVRTASMRERPRALSRYATRPVLERPGYSVLLRTNYYVFTMNWGPMRGLPRPAGAGEFHDLSWCLAKALEERGSDLGTSVGAVFQRIRSTESRADAVAVLESIRGLKDAWYGTVLREAGAAAGSRDRPDGQAHREAPREQVRSEPAARHRVAVVR